MVHAFRSWRIVSLALVLALGAAPVNARGFRVVHDFVGSDGQWPYSRLLLGSDGNFYGTTLEGGTGNCFGGCGVIFKLAPDGTETVLYSFQGGSDGAFPYAGVIADASRNLYGTTSEGGGSGCDGLGCGTIYKFTPGGNETVLYSFKGGKDGANPLGGLFADASGNLYGTTVNGGSVKTCNFHVGCGTVFKLAAAGGESVLFGFESEKVGENPQGGVIGDSSGSLYGTTLNGGSNNYGVVYKLAPDGRESVLYAFKGGADGDWPYGELTIDGTGNLYGTTQYGGAHAVGTVFRVSADGSETLLHSFNPDTKEGYNPVAGVILDGSGNLYGTTFEGGSSHACMGGCGTIFKLAQDGTYTVLHALIAKQGISPSASLALDGKGHLYGTAPSGGKRACAHQYCGTIFEVDR